MNEKQANSSDLIVGQALLRAKKIIDVVYKDQQVMRNSPELAVNLSSWILSYDQHFAEETNEPGKMLAIKN